MPQREPLGVMTWRCEPKDGGMHYLAAYARCFCDRYSSRTSDATKMSKALSAKRPGECVWLN